MDSKSDLIKLSIDRKLIEDVFEWDVLSWSQAISFWANGCKKVSEKKVLELGARGGGLTLLFALAGAEVICSDFGGPSAAAEILHNQYEVAERVKYADIDATAISFPNDSFDIVTFKSVLGGIAGNGNIAARERAICEILRVLKPGGFLLFAENLTGSGFHSFMREKFVRWGQRWNYLALEDVPKVFESFGSLKYSNWGFFASFGFNGKQRNALFYLDKLVAPLIPERSRYIIFGIAQKPMDGDRDGS